LGIILGIGESVPLTLGIILVLLWLFGGAIKILVMGFVMRVHRVTRKDVAKYVREAAADVDNALLKVIRALAEFFRALRGSKSETDHAKPDPREIEPPREESSGDSAEPRADPQ
jgi:hypothetical protein